MEKILFAFLGGMGFFSLRFFKKQVSAVNLSYAMPVIKSRYLWTGHSEG
jgi:hypothetical protein